MRAMKHVALAFGVGLAVVVLWLLGRRVPTEARRAPGATPARAASAEPLPAGPVRAGDRGSVGKDEVAVRVVRDEDGAPIAGAIVSYVGERDRATDAEGYAYFPRGADTSVAARATGRATAAGGYSQLEAAPFVLLKLSVLRDVRVELVDAAGAPLALERDVSSALRVAVRSTCAAAGSAYDASGTVPARVSRDGDGPAWKLEIRAPGGACVHALLGETVVGARDVAATDARATIAVDAAALESARSRASEPFVVRVSNGATATPVPNARVVVRVGPGRDVELRTAMDGRARFEGVLAGELTVAASADGYAPAEILVTRPIRSDVEIALVVGRSISGLALDGDGRPVPGARLGVYAASRLGGVTQPIVVVETGADGTFESVGLAREELVVVAIGSGDGRGYLPRRDALPPTATIVAAGADTGDVRVLVSADAR